MFFLLYATLFMHILLNKQRAGEGGDAHVEGRREHQSWHVLVFQQTCKHKFYMKLNSNQQSCNVVSSAGFTNIRQIVLTSNIISHSNVA